MQCELTSAWPGYYAELACNVNDGASLLWVLLERLLFQHVPQFRATAEPRAPVVDVVQPIKVFSRHVHSLDDVASKDARAVNSIVKSVKLVENRVDERVDKTLVSNVSCFVEDLSRRVDCKNVFSCLVEGVWVDVGDGDFRTARARKALADSGTDTCKR